MAEFPKNSDNSAHELAPGFTTQPASLHGLPIPFEAPTAEITARKLPTLNKENWNKVFPYSFAIYVDHGGGHMSLLTDLSKFSVPRVILNLAPSSISIGTPFANSLSASGGGVTEQNNGIVFRPISISGTTGLFPKRTSATDGIPRTGILGAAASLAPATTSAISSLVGSAQSVLRSIKDSPRSEQLPMFDPANPNNLLHESGYYQFWYLHNFLVAYAEQKKVKKNASLRLVFESPKDNIAYVCTPNSFDMVRDAGKPYLYNYKIQLTSWDMVPISGTIKPIDIDQNEVPSSRNAGAIKSVLNVLRSTRNTILQAKNVLLAANSDVNDVLSVFQQGYLSVKGIAGIPGDISDFASSVKANANALLKTDFANTLSKTWNNEAAAGNPDAKLALGSGLSGNTSNVAATNVETTKTPSGETLNPLSSSNSAPSINQGLTTALDLALNDPEVSEKMPISDFTLPDQLQTSISKTIEKAQATPAHDIRDIAKRLQQMSDALAVTTNSMDAAYERVYSPITQVNQTRPLTDDDIITQAALQEAKSAYISLLATGDLYEELEPDPFVIANESLPAESQMESPLSTYPVIVDGGATIEKIAMKHLGDPNRAQEIITLNGLSAPYIDEDGFQVSLSSLTGRTAIVSSIDNLYLNQQVVISGTGRGSVRRRISNIEEFGSDAFRIWFDDEPVLNVKFPASSNPIMTARLPGCVGSGDTLLIPSSDSVDEFPTRPTDLQRRLTHAERVFKIDWLFGPDGDLVVQPNGDFGRSFGYQNAIQALQFRLETELKELEQHPGYGLPISVGKRTSDITLAELKDKIKASVLNDSRFYNADVDVQFEGNAVRITVNAHGAANTGLVPVEFRVNRGA